MTDLKLIAELLLLFKPLNKSWSEFDRGYNVTGEAIGRLRQVWKSGEMPDLPGSLADYFSRPLESGCDG